MGTVARNEPEKHPDTITLSRDLSLIPVQLPMEARVRAYQSHRLPIIGVAFDASTSVFVERPLTGHSFRRTANRGDPKWLSK